MIIKPAEEKDCFEISAMINTQANKGNMLSKTPEQIQNLLYNYFAAFDNNQIIGCCGFKVWTNSHEYLTEIISLTTKEEYTGQGIGTKLVQSCLKKARRCGLKKFFTLTIRPNLFLRIGFRKVHIKEFPEKIWTDCSSCPKNFGTPFNPKCDEIVLQLF